MSHHFDYIDEQLQFLEKDMEQILDLKSNSWQFLETDQRESAQNFIRYLTLRSKDIRNLQDMLHEDGLSSL
ncbi:MAG: pyruvate kinase, partial [Saprospirales bacterium]